MPEFYRGGSRSSFSAQVWGGALTIGNTPSSTTIVTVPTGSQWRIKRVQIVAMLPKSGSSTTAPAEGWMAFYREDDETNTQVAQLAAANPQVLRPKPFVTNPDHAIYLELYLEAITLDGGAKLHIMGDLLQGGTDVQVSMAGKYYVESSLHV